MYRKKNIINIYHIDICRNIRLELYNIYNLKPIAPFVVKFQDKFFLLRGHLATFKARVKVINPTQPAALACSV